MIRSKWVLGVFAVVAMSACASKKIANVQPKKKVVYQTPVEGLHRECAEGVGTNDGERSMTLKPDFMILNVDADIFCIQKLRKNAKFLKVVSALEPIVEKTSSSDKKLLATTFDLVIYDRSFKQVKAPKPVYRSNGSTELVAYYDFSKEKKFPKYVVTMFHHEDREKVVFTDSMQSSDEASISHNVNAAAAGLAMGGFSAGTAASLPQRKENVKYFIYSRTPKEVGTEWVKSIPSASPKK